MKNIVICCDGTSNGISGDGTNVLRFYRCLERDDQQLAYYDSGVGTIADPSMLTDSGKSFGKKLDMAVGYSVKRQVIQAYRFLVEHFQIDDRVFLIGFSRGAYAIRALAGMIHSLGLLRNDCQHLVELGWSIYCGADFKACSNFKYAFSRAESVPVYFVGAFDTVSSFGLMTSFKTLPYTRHNPSIAHVRHAVAMHEKRSCFKANLFSDKTQDLVEVWFPGSHSDVGGGYPEKESGLAKVTLKWMFAYAQEFGCHFQLDQIKFYLGQSNGKYFQCKPDLQASPHKSIDGFWHLLEFLPRRQWNHDIEPEKMTWYWPNLYRKRKIPNNAVFFA